MRVEPDFNIDYIPFGDTGRARVEIHDFECPSKNGSGGHYAYLYLSKDACVKNGDGTYDILLGHERDTDLDYWMPTSDRSLGRLITDHGVEVEGRASFRTPAELVQDDGRDIIGPAMERVAPKDRRLPSYDGVVWARDVDGGYGLGM